MTRTNHRAYGSWIFGVILLGFVFAVFWLAPNALPSFKQQILAFSAALLAGLFGFFLTGDMTLAMSHKESRTSLKAAGGIALFVLVLGWWNSSAAPVIVEQVQQEVSHHDGGQILSTQKQVAYPQREGINIGRDFTISVNDNGRTDVKVDNKIIYQVDTAAIEQLGIAKSSVSNFFNILDQKNIPISEWDNKLREIANEYKKIKQKTPGEVDDFSFVNIDGDTHQFSEYLGKWVIVNYWATYCEPCIANLPTLNKVASHFKGDAVVLAIEAGETPRPDLKKFVEDMKINYSVIPTQDSVMFALGFIYGVPTTFIVDPHGEIVTTHMGEITINDLDESIK